MGNIHLKRSSLIVFGIFILIYPEYSHIRGKPPNVCAHYLIVLPLFQKQPYDLVLLDIRMPHLDGYQVMAQLREISGGDYLPVMVLTAQTDQDTKIKALDAGAMDFLHKPFDRVEVLTRIRNMIEARLLHNQVRDQNAILEVRVRERTRELEDTPSVRGMSNKVKHLVSVEEAG